MQSALGHRVVAKLVGELLEDGSAERQVAQVILEGGEAGNGLPAHPKSGYAIGDHLFGFWDHLEDGAAERLERAALWLVEAAQIVVDRVAAVAHLESSQSMVLAGIESSQSMVLAGTCRS